MDGSFKARADQVVEISGVRFKVDREVVITPLAPYGRIIPKRVSGALIDRVMEALPANTLASDEPQD